MKVGCRVWTGRPVGQHVKDQFLEVDGEKFRLAPGMQVSAEIHLGTRTVLEYLLSPVQKAFHEAACER